MGVTPPASPELAHLVRDALVRLYDPVFLQSHPLGRALELPPGGGRGGTGAALMCRVRSAPR